MPQKVLAGRAADPLLRQDIVHVKVDQVILTRSPARPLASALEMGMKKTPVEVAVAYDGTCVSNVEVNEARLKGRHDTVPPEALLHNILIARPGVGFPAPVHLERFASPARLAVTDDPRLASVGGIGMLSLVLPPSQLAHALAHGTVTLRPPCSVQILLSGRVRPFVCARDVALELLRCGLAEMVQEIDTKYGAPVVLEFAGPSARLLSVPERAVLCAIAPAVGAASALFVSDDKSETFLRDQRRSKAHRALAPDAGAPCDDVLSIDLATVDPLLMDTDGEIKAVRDLAKQPVRQVILGGDSGVTLRDMLAAAALLKSKRVPSRLEFLVAPPSRQILEVLAHTGALVDLMATGARLIEPDQRVITGELYPPCKNEISVRTFDPEPRAKDTHSFVVTSAETLAYCVANGQIGDPRAFKRPVRVTVPRVFPTEDVLIIRPRKANLANIGNAMTVEPAKSFGWKDSPLTLLAADSKLEGDCIAIVCDNDQEVRRIAIAATSLVSRLRAVIGLHIPRGIAAMFNGMGIAAFGADPNAFTKLRKAKKLSVPCPSDWPEDGAVTAKAGKIEVQLRWLGHVEQRSGVETGNSQPDQPNIKPISR
ncbi:MAG: 3-isopropylmalate dehydratase [Sorangium cellulosum]|nr:MAG: 3-isopropylmalate dehydratase [Sorangium cellulosum]